MKPMRSGLFVALSLAAFGAVAANAADPTVEFTVLRTDTLIALSRDVLVSPDAWQEVARINRLRNPNRIWPGQVLRVPVRLMRSVPQAARLVSSAGDVKVAGVPVTETQAGGNPLIDGQTIETGPASSAVLQLADGSRVRLPPSSLAQVVASQTYGARPGDSATADSGAPGGWFVGAMRVLRGSVEVFATKVLRAKPLEVITPTAVVGVRGTQFRVGFDEAANGSARAEVVEGLVRFDTASRSAGADLPAGSGAVADASGSAPRTAKLLAAPDLSGIPERFESPIIRFGVPGPATALRVQVASDTAFDRIVSDQRIDPGAEIRIAGLEDAQWFVRARRIGDEGLEGFDGARTITLKARPEPPAYRAPRADAKQSIGAIEFAWARNSAAPQVRLQVAEDAAFARVIQDTDKLAATSLRADLKTPGVYFWRMASVRTNGDQGPFGQPQRFELRPLPEPATGGLAGDGQSLVFKWNGRPQDRQEVQLSRDANFSDVSAQASIAASEWTLPAPPRSGRYYFRYRSIEPDGFVSPYSDPMEIEIPIDWKPLWMLAPLLLLL